VSRNQPLSSSDLLTPSRPLVGGGEDGVVLQERRLPGQQQFAEALRLAGEQGELGAARDQGRIHAGPLGDRVAVAADLLLALKLAGVERLAVAVVVAAARERSRIAGQTGPQGLLGWDGSARACRGAAS
jgi:hypothetical protein